ncbi:ATP-binding protein [Streptomyces sp. NBC_01431]|uniref:ATP-binding protein n=1 Tax=Streptomyces sp. NBC_01431 TaxID=2903863 RepID=UPI002E37CA25|nr:ATP-binding protein [Streptomyces sp. NBC_01431]
MDTRRAERHEHVMNELDAFAHWYVEPDPSSAGNLLQLTLFAEFPDTLRVARDMATTFLQGSVADETVADVRLIVSELVGNVVHHAVPDCCLARPGGSRRNDVTFKLWPKWLFVGVADEDSTPPLLPLGDTFSLSLGLLGELPEAVLPDSGRGLLLVQRVAAAVWWMPKEPGGKTVWCRFDLDGETADRRP